MPLRVLHLVGSAESDFLADLSRLYAADCLAATADPDRCEPVIAHVSPDRRWRFPAGLDDAEIAAAAPLSLADAISHLEAEVFDVALPQMFCRPGLTSYRALLDLLRIPYVGNRPEVMALTLNKARARALVAAAGVGVPEGELLGPGERPGIEPPAVVKPVDGDNSVGVTLVRDRAEYGGALEAAFAAADEVLVERYVELGREVRCGAIVRDGDLVPLPLEEYDVDPARRPIRAYADKLARGADGELELVAKDGRRAWIVDRDDPITAPVQAAARTCHAALGCRHYSLFDFRIDPDGRPWFLEAGLYNSFARQSVIATMARATGIEAPELLALALREALGDGFLSPQVTGRLIELVAEEDGAAARRRGARERLEELSGREREVALAVGEGRANAEIAAELHMSVATVKAHVSRLLRELDLDNRVQIALFVRDALG